MDKNFISVTINYNDVVYIRNRFHVTNQEEMVFKRDSYHFKILVSDVMKVETLNAFHKITEI